jgi:4-amino-4-deoxy-L-arabinose transferase-like glycosyltransferase
VGVLLPLLVMLAGRTAARREVVPSLRAVSRGLAGWCVVVLPWGLAFVRRIGAGSTIDLIRGEVLDRYFAGTTHVEPPWFYAKVVGVGLLPWVAPLLLAVVRSWRLRRSPVAGTALYAAGGLVAGLVFFSLGQGKEANYILPLVPLAALLVTWELARELEAPSKLTLGPILLTATALAATVILALAAGLRFQGAPRVVAIIGSVAFGVAAVVAGVGTFRHRPRMVYASVAAATAATFLGAVLVLLPAIGERKSAAPLIDAVPVLRSGRPLVTVEIRVPSLTFYLRRPAEVLDMTALATRIAAADDPLFVLADVDADDIPADLVPRLREVGRHGKFLVYEKR